MVTHGSAVAVHDFAGIGHRLLRTEDAGAHAHQHQRRSKKQSHFLHHKPSSKRSTRTRTVAGQAKYTPIIFSLLNLLNIYNAYGTRTIFPSAPGSIISLCARGASAS